jgi:hypothetical protein
VRLSTLFDRARQLVSLPGPSSEAKPAQGEAGSDVDTAGWWYSDLAGGGPDVNPELSGSKKFEVYDEMRKTDPVVKSTLLFQKLPVRSAAWGLNPRHDNCAICRGVRDCVNWNLGIEDDEDGQLDISWDETNQQALLALDFGAMLEEQVWGDVREWVDADGDRHLVRPLVRLAPRYPRSISKVKRSGARITSIEQWAQEARPIPGEKLVHLIPEREGARWDGVSMLRPMWGPWRLKGALMIAAGIGWDRYAAGLPVIWHPDTTEGERKAKEIGRDIRHHERGYVHLPTKDGFTREESAWGIDLLNGAQTLADPVPLLRWYSAQEAEAGLAHFSQLGNTETGSRAVAETQIDPFFLAVQSLAEYVRAERQRQVIRKIVEVNFGTEVAENHSPVLTVSKIQARSIQVIANALEALHNAGYDFAGFPAVVSDVAELLGFQVDVEEAPTARDAGAVAAAVAGFGLTPEQIAQIEASLGVKPAPLPSEGAGLSQNGR